VRDVAGDDFKAHGAFWAAVRHAVGVAYCPRRQGFPVHSARPQQRAVPFVYLRWPELLQGDGPKVRDDLALDELAIALQGFRCEPLARVQPIAEVFSDRNSGRIDRGSVVDFGEKANKHALSIPFGPADGVQLRFFSAPYRLESRVSRTAEDPSGFLQR
jgi:hypothetical protein